LGQYEREMMHEVDLGRAARLLHHRKEGLTQGAPIVPPIVLSSAYHLPAVQAGGHFYTRAGNPTWDEVEAQLAILEDAPCIVFPSGMAAISAALMACVQSGGRVVLPLDGYYVTRAFAEAFLRPMGVDVVYLGARDYGAADFAGASAVYIETPTNPHLDMVDIAAVALRARAAGARVIVDNTTMTAILQRPLDLGADLVVAADTKAPAGHGDVLFGHVAGRDGALMGRVGDWRRMAGAIPSPFDAWLVHRGIETLELRLSRMCASAGVIAQRLQGHPALVSLRYPGLPDDLDHALAVRQMVGFGFLIGLCFAGEAEAEGFLARCPMVAQATSFGGVHTSGERRARWGDAVPLGFVRLSVGIEPLEPLWAAIAGALKG
jgi:cystathionine gamma-lyase